MRTETKEKLRAELARLATSTDPRVRWFIKSLGDRYPALFPSSREKPS